MKKIISVFFCIVLALMMFTALPASAQEHEHQFVEQKHVEATCTEGDYFIFKCAFCDATKRMNGRTAALGHSFSWTVVDPTCAADGSKTGVCDRCGHTWTGIIPALGCDWSEWTVVQDAADGQTGYRVRECRRCGSKELEYFDSDGNILSLPEDKYSYDAVTVSMVEVSKAKYDQGYAAGDAVTFSITINNNTDIDVLVLMIQDVMSDMADVIQQVPVLGSDKEESDDKLTVPANGSSQTEFTYTVTKEDAARGFISCYARICWRYVGDSDYYQIYRFSDTLLIECVDAPILMTNEVISVPASDRGFRVGDDVELRLTFINTTDRDVVITEIVDWEADDSEWHINVLGPDSAEPGKTLELPANGTASIDFTYTVNEGDQDVSDYAIATWNYKENDDGETRYVTASGEIHCRGSIEHGKTSDRLKSWLNLGKLRDWLGALPIRLQDAFDGFSSFLTGVFGK